MAWVFPHGIGGARKVRGTGATRPKEIFFIVYTIKVFFQQQLFLITELPLLTPYANWLINAVMSLVIKLLYSILYDGSILYNYLL